MNARQNIREYLNLTLTLFFKASNPLSLAYLRTQLLIGATFEDNEATAWFSNFGHHDSPISLGYVHSAILRGLCKTCNLTVSNHPIQAHYTDQVITRSL